MPLTPRIKRSCQIGIAALACFAALAVAGITASSAPPAPERSAKQGDQTLSEAQRLDVVGIPARPEHVVESRPAQGLNTTRIVQGQAGQSGVELLVGEARLPDLKGERLASIHIVRDSLPAEIADDIYEGARRHQRPSNAAQPRRVGEDVGERASAAAQGDESQGSTNAPVEARVPFMQPDFVGKVVTGLSLSSPSAFIAHYVISSELSAQAAPVVRAETDSCSAGCPSATVARGSAQARDGSLVVSLVGLVRGWHFNPTAKEATSFNANDVPDNLVIVSPRVCAALAVYELAPADDFGLRATVASTALNAFRDADRVPDCSPGVARAVSAGFEPRRWKASLDAVDAVTSGSFMISPDACVRANAVVPLSTADGDEPANSPVVARSQCVISNLAFVEVTP